MPALIKLYRYNSFDTHDGCAVPYATPVGGVRHVNPHTYFSQNAGDLDRSKAHSPPDYSTTDVLDRAQR